MDTNWLGELEEKVGAAVAELESLRKQNRTSKSRLKKLQKQLAEAGQGTTSSRGSGADWEKERRQILHRVQRLAGRLERLLQA